MSKINTFSARKLIPETQICSLHAHCHLSVFRITIIWFRMNIYLLMIKKKKIVQSELMPA